MKGVEDHFEAYLRLCEVLGMTDDLYGFHSAMAMGKAADEIKRLRKIICEEGIHSIKLHPAFKQCEWCGDQW